MNICQLIRVTTNVQQQCKRAYAFKSDLKIKWVRPEKISCIKPEKSGDVGTLPTVNPNEFIHEFKDSEELKSADSIVQSLFRLGNTPHINRSKYVKELMIKEVQRHPLDYGSMEAKLARMTATIRLLQEQMEKFPRDSRKKVTLKELIDKRKKYLKYLRRWDYRRFEWILEKLDLVYKPPPAIFHWNTRKESLQKLTDLHEEKIKEERLAGYRKKLEEQQIPFLEEYIPKLELLRREQINCEIPVTVSEELIGELKTRLANLKQEN